MHLVQFWSCLPVQPPYKTPVQLSQQLIRNGDKMRQYLLIVTRQLSLAIELYLTQKDKYRRLK